MIMKFDSNHIITFDKVDDFMEEIKVRLTFFEQYNMYDWYKHA